MAELVVPRPVCRTAGRLVNVAKEFLGNARKVALDEDLTPVETGRLMVDAICVADAVKAGPEEQEGGS